jgi:hypothetical protein
MRSSRVTITLMCLVLCGCGGDKREQATARPAKGEPSVARRVTGWDWVARPGSAVPEPSPAFAHDAGSAEVGAHLEKMDALAADIYAADEQSLRKTAGEMSRLVKWAGGTPGYGNFLLASRAQDLGSIAVARLLVDHNLSIEEASGLMEGLQSWEATPEWTAAVLDAELGTTAFSKAVARAEEKDRLNTLHHIWEAMKAAVELARDDGEILEQASERIVSKLQTMGIPRGLYEDLHEVLVAELDYGRLLTSTERWRCRQLGLIAGPSPPDSLRRARSLIEYKELIGRYPTDPPPSPPPEGVSYGNLTAVGKAFAFELSKKNLPLRCYSASDIASETYESIKAGTLLDSDSQLRLNGAVEGTARRPRVEAQKQR